MICLIHSPVKSKHVGVILGFIVSGVQFEIGLQNYGNHLRKLRILFWEFQNREVKLIEVYRNCRRYIIFFLFRL